MEYSYYGRNDGTPPRKGVHEFMTDEMVQPIIERIENATMKTLNEMLREFKKEILVSMKELNKIVKLINNETIAVGEIKEVEPGKEKKRKNAKTATDMKFTENC